MAAGSQLKPEIMHQTHFCLDFLLKSEVEEQSDLGQEGFEIAS